MKTPKNLQVLSKTRVDGKACTWFPGLNKFPSIQVAVEEAIKNGPAGTTALKDAKVDMVQYLIIPLLCYEVEGFPVKE